MPTRRTPPAGSLLAAASLPAADRIDVGSRFAAAPLVDHARAMLTKMPSYPFASYGFDADWTRKVESLLTSIDAHRAKLDATHEDALPTGAALDALVAQAKEFRRDALTVAAILPGNAYHRVPKTSGSSVVGLVSSLRLLGPVVARATTTPHGTGRAMRERAKALLTELEAARAAHKKALAKLSPEAKALHADKGTLYEELKRVARVARRIAPNEPELRAVTTHVRASRKGHRASGVTATQPAAPAAGTAG